MSKLMGSRIVPSTDLAAAGTPDSTKFLRGDNAWATPSGGSIPQVYRGTVPALPTPGTWVTIPGVTCDENSPPLAVFRDMGGGGQVDLDVRQNPSIMDILQVRADVAFGSNTLAYMVVV
jgi:hypothetical protein